MKTIKRTSVIFIAALTGLCFSGITYAKEKPAETQKNIEYQVSKSTLYNQLSYDLGKHGYSLKWDIREDSNFTPHTYLSDRDEISDTLNVLNTKIDGTFDSGNYVQGLICQEKKQIVITYSKFAKGVVDRDGHSCLLISPVKSDSNSQQSYNTYSYSTSVPSSNQQSQNVPGARIVGG